MTDIESFALITSILLCVGIAVAIGFLVYLLFSYKIRLIQGGLDDKKIKKQYDEDHSKGAKAMKVAGIVVNAVLGIFFASCFASSIYVNVFHFDEPVLGVSPKVVMSGSMSEKNENATYLVENNLNDQFQVYDIVFLEPLPGEYELQKYDIVVYSYDDTMIIHRIINIEEPTPEHPNERWFQLRGDANPRPDSRPVTYSQMRGIYRGNRIRFAGLFVSFFQSPLGYLSIGVVAAYLIVWPLAEKKYDIAVYSRLVEIGYAKPEELEILLAKKKRKTKKKPAPEGKAEKPDGANPGGEG